MDLDMSIRLYSIKNGEGTIYHTRWHKGDRAIFVGIKALTEIITKVSFVC